MSTPINLDVLKGYKTDLYNAVVESLGLGLITGIFQVSKLQWWGFPENVRTQLVAFLRTKGPTEHDETCGCNECFQKRMAAHSAKEKERLALQARAKAAAARLLQYIQQGLRDNEHKRQKWAEFESKLPQDVALSPALIDQFISGWRSVLEWDTPSPAPAPSAPTLEPVVLSDGSVQKSLEETPDRTWTVAQCKDWLKRSDAQKLFRNQQYGGSSQSSWFHADSQVI